jgi:hypothetical protein
MKEITHHPWQLLRDPCIPKEATEATVAEVTEEGGRLLAVELTADLPSKTRRGTHQSRGLIVKGLVDLQGTTTDDTVLLGPTNP